MSAVDAFPHAPGVRSGKVRTKAATGSSWRPNDGVNGIAPTEAPAADCADEARPDSRFMVGDSPAMRQIFDLIRRFARTDFPVLITGESGTGKELAARAIHDYSARAAGPFLPVNCASLPSELIASELFGYEKGAFTGAVERKQGFVEAADHGTLFLDEIGDLGVGLQGHLLRFLQEGRIVRVGGRVPIGVDVRIVAATNIDLGAAVKQGRFREDLYYRLDVLNLKMPPLRERGDDAYLLAMFFLRGLAADFDREVTGFDAEATALIRKHRWPGNVRELIAAIRRALVVGNEALVAPGDLGLELLPGSDREHRRPRPGSVEERQLVLAALDRNHHVVSHVARELGVSRVTLYRMLRRNKLQPAAHGSGEETASPDAALRLNAESDASNGHS